MSSHHSIQAIALVITAVTTVALTAVTGVASAQVQSPAMVDADRLYEAASDAFDKASAAIERGDPAAARTHYTLMHERLLEAQRHLRTEIHRYRYSDAIALQGLGRIGEAWIIMQELAAQTDAPEIATDASAAAAETLAHLPELGQALLDLQCGEGGIEVRVKAAGSTAPPLAPPILDTWMSCPAWGGSRVLPGGNYALQARRSAGTDEATQAIPLPAGRKQVIAVHHLLAPAPVVTPRTGGCLSAGR